MNQNEKAYKEQQIVFQEIKRVLKSFENISSDTFLCINDVAQISEADIWEYNFKSFTLLFILPNSHTIDIDDCFSLISNYSKYYIIDVFEKIKDENSIKPNSFYNFLFNLKNYRNQFNDILELSNIEKFYSDRTVKIDNDLERNEDSFGQVQDLLNNWSNNVIGGNPILLLGDRGIGKSWTVKKFCIDQFKLHKENPWIYPCAIYINLRVLAKEIFDQIGIVDALKYQIQKNYSLNLFPDSSIWEAFLKCGKLIIVLDGFDEMSKEITNEILIKNIWEVFSLTRKTSKIIITSRINLFKSREYIYEHFAFSKFKQTKKNQNVYIHEEREARKDFNIWELNELNSIEVQLFNDRYKLGYLDKGIEKLQKIKDTYTSIGQIQYEVYEISKIPALYTIITYLLGTNKYDLLEIIELSLKKAIIEFNISADRAIDEFYIIEGDSIKPNEFDTERKLNILEHIAWYLFERHDYDFSMKELSNFINEILGYDYNIISNDLRTQTVIRLNSRDNYEFISEGIFAYFIFKYLCNLFCTQNSDVVREGLKEFGKYNLTDSTLGKRVLVYFNKFLDNNPDLRIILSDPISKIIKDSRPFSPWLKYMKSNCLEISISPSNLIELDYWSKDIFHLSDPIINQIKNELVLIPKTEYRDENEIKDIPPFYLSSTEITNKQFQYFLNDIEFAEKYKKDRKFELNGNYWNPKIKDFSNTPFEMVTNDYLIIYWINGEIPKGKENHPIVWVSWYLCASFCNWLSLKNEPQLKPFYKFNYNEISEKLINVTINTRANGYRLPNKLEWETAAREGNLNATTVWDGYKDEKGVLSGIGERLRVRLMKFNEDSYPIKSERPNTFGIYGLMGNVREWVDRPNSQENIDIYSKQLLKGAAWLISNNGLDIEFTNELIAQNNNVDVGFRVARSLTDTELNIINSINN